MKARRLPFAIAIALLALAVGALITRGDPNPAEPSTSSEPPADPPAKRSRGRPSLLVVMVDDQAMGSFTGEVMPSTLEFFADGGTVFEQAIAAPPLCCPARAGFLTGRYAHNHGVVENDVGYETMRGKRRTFPVALQAAGYRTAMVGKFLNGYDRTAGARPAPGFDRWFAMLGSADYFDFEVSDQGRRRFAADYSTRVLTRRARDFVDTTSRRPFFLWLSYNAPHTVLPGNPPPCEGRDAQPPSAGAVAEFADAALPRPPSFNEKDTSSRPSLAGHPDRLGRGEVTETERSWRCSLAAMRAVDRQLSRLLGDLRRSGRLRETVVVYVSDNGNYYGEHRLTEDKRLPLEPALHVPMAIRVGDAIDGGPDPPAIDRLVSQVDLAPTLLDYADADPCPDRGRCEPMDARSLRPLLEGGEWPDRRAIPLTLDDGWSYAALRSEGELYMELTANRKREFPEPERELYDLRADPNELENLAADPGPATRERLRSLSVELARLTDCAGIRGRDERTGNRPYCE